MNFFNPDTDEYTSTTTTTATNIVTSLSDPEWTGDKSDFKTEFKVSWSKVYSNGKRVTDSAGGDIIYSGYEEISTLGFVEEDVSYEYTSNNEIKDPVAILVTYTITKKKSSYNGETLYFLLVHGGDGEGSENYWVAQWTSNPVTGETEISNSTQEVSYYSLGYDLSGVVSKWYYVLLRIGIVVMMSILVYIGIRILLSSVAADKAKYKQMLMDWIIGMILLFTMHYIMVFANTLNDYIIAVVEESTARIYNPTYIFASKTTKYKKLIEGLEEDEGINLYNAIDPDDNDFDKDDKNDIEDYNGDGVVDEEDVYQAYLIAMESSVCAYQYEDDDGNICVQVATNMMGAIRMQYNYAQDSSDSFIGYAIMFIVMTLFTIQYVFIYFKRVIMMAFLTIIAPLVAVTYPLDKANDGTAQGFDMWFKEYMFNLLIQPMHLLLYVILIGSAIDVAAENLIWSIVVMMFMTEGEEILRRLFNFQKASTPPSLKNALVAGATMSGMKSLFGKASKGKQGGANGNGGNSGGSGDDDDNDLSPDNNINMKDIAGNLMGGGSDATGEGDGTQEEDGGSIEEPDDYTNPVMDYLNAEEDEETEDDGYNALRDIYRTQGYQEDEIEDLINGHKGINGEKDDVENNGNTENNENTTITGKRLGTKLKGKADGAKRQVKGVAKGASKVLKATKPLLKAGVGAALGATGAMVGLAAGVTTGDFSKVATYAAAGATAGTAAGVKIGDTTVDNVSKGLDRIARGRVGSDEEKQARVDDRIKEMAKNRANIEKVQRNIRSENGATLSRKEAQEWITNNTKKQYEYGEDLNLDSVIKNTKYMENYKKKNPSVTANEEQLTKQAIGIRQTAEATKGKKKSDVMDYLENYAGITDSNARSKMFDEIKSYNEIK